jgi:membrane protein
MSATAVFGQLQVALNTVWAVKSKPRGLGILAWLRKRLLSVGLIFSLGFLLLVSLVVSSSISAALHTMQGRVPGSTKLLWTVTDLVIPFFVYLLLFMALFRYIPDAKLRWRHVAFGGLVTAFLFVLGKYLIGLYLGTSALGSTYGAAGSLALMMVWSYYSAAIVMFGAELTQAHVCVHGERVKPEEHAVPEAAPQHTKRATEVGVPSQQAK